MGKYQHHDWMGYVRQSQRLQARVKEMYVIIEIIFQ